MFVFMDENIEYLCLAGSISKNISVGSEGISTFFSQWNSQKELQLGGVNEFVSI